MRDRKLLTHYEEALAASYDWFIQQGRPAPPLDRNGKIPVYVFAVDDDELDCGSPQMDELIFRDALGRMRFEPAVVLHSRSAEPLKVFDLEQAQVTAVHELSHYFNSKFLPYRRIGPDGPEPPPQNMTHEEFACWQRSWLWFDEGLALLAEAEVFPSKHDWLAYAVEPVDRPHRALDCQEDTYLGMLFVRYLHRRMQMQREPTFLNRVWQMSKTVWDPISTPQGPIRHAAVTALAEALRQLGYPFPFCSASEPDLFASGFCFDSYFLHEPGSAGHEPAIFDRFSGRAVTRSWVLSPGQSAHSSMMDTYPLAGLGCRYFRFFSGATPARLRVKVTAPAGYPLKAELAYVSVGNRFLVKGSRTTGGRTPESGQDVLTCELDGFSNHACDHAVLVVANCGIGPSHPNDPTPSGYSQNVEFAVAAECAITP